MTRALPVVAEKISGADGAEGNPVLTVCCPVLELKTLLLIICVRH